MNTYRVKEPIRVAVVFGPGRSIKPVWFDWHNCKHTVQETTYRWQGKAGEATLLYFTVSDGEGLYELVYNTADQSWSLEALQAI